MFALLPDSTAMQGNLHFVATISTAKEHWPCAAVVQLASLMHWLDASARHAGPTTPDDSPAPIGHEPGLVSSQFPPLHMKLGSLPRSCPAQMQRCDHSCGSPATLRAPHSSFFFSSAHSAAYLSRPSKLGRGTHMLRSQDGLQMAPCARDGQNASPMGIPR